MQNFFDVERFIFKSEKCNELSSDYLIVDRLCKKIDVVKSVFKFYTADLATKKSDDEIGEDTYKLLLKILSNDNILDFKFLNSALKLNDILFSKSIINEEEQALNKEFLLNKIPLLLVKA